jgi:pSer/pThr/pTyr-binding forkhead associated (FHA) protein
MAIRFTIFPPGDAGRPSVIVFDMEKILIGRGSICDLRLPHPHVSYHHATVEVDGARYTIRDESSTNGTTVNGEHVPSDFKQLIRSDDIIEIGGFKIVPSLSVPMEGIHSDERTESIARTLLGTTADVKGPTRLEVLEGPDAGLSFEMHDGNRHDIRFTDPKLEGMRFELDHGPTGWTLMRAGDPGPPVRLLVGQSIEIGDNVLRFDDPLEAYYSTLLSTREDLELPPPQIEREEEDEEDTEEDVLPPDTPAPAVSPSAPPSDETITSRTEVVGADREQTRMPEYSWVVVLLGVIAFLASLGLILLLIF